MRKVNVGILCSSGGATPIAAYDICSRIYPGYVAHRVVTDRACAMEGACDERGIPFIRIEDPDRQGISQRAAAYFSGVDCVTLFFMRIITEDLFNAFPTVNLHPSVLPAYPGTRPIEKSLKDKAGVIGATMHMTNEILDGGEIIMQVSSPVPDDISLQEAHSLSFCQKTWLQLSLLANMLEHDFRFDRPLQEPSRQIRGAYNDYLTDIGYEKWRLP